jgi:hypothetical protein
MRRFPGYHGTDPFARNRGSAHTVEEDRSIRNLYTTNLTLFADLHPPSQPRPPGARGISGMLWTPAPMMNNGCLRLLVMLARRDPALWQSGPPVTSCESPERRRSTFQPARSPEEPDRTWNTVCHAATTLLDCETKPPAAPCHLAPYKIAGGTRPHLEHSVPRGDHTPGLRNEAIRLPPSHFATRKNAGGATPP